MIPQTKVGLTIIWTVETGEECQLHSKNSKHKQTVVKLAEELTNYPAVQTVEVVHAIFQGDHMLRSVIYSWTVGE